MCNGKVTEIFCSFCILIYLINFGPPYSTQTKVFSLNLPDYTSVCHVQTHLIDMSLTLLFVWMHQLGWDTLHVPPTYWSMEFGDLMQLKYSSTHLQLQQRPNLPKVKRPVCFQFRLK